MLQKKGYDGCNGLGLNNNGRLEPVIPKMRPPTLGLGFVSLRIGPSSSKVTTHGKGRDSNDEITPEDTRPETDSNEWEWSSFSSSSYALDNIFIDLDNLPMEDKHAITPLPKRCPHAWIESFWDPSSELDTSNSDSDTTNVYIFTISALSLLKTDDDMPLVYPQLIQYDQQEPLTLDCFQNDEAIAEFLGLREGIPQGDHKAGFSIDLDSIAYFGESTPSSSHQNEKRKEKIKNQKNRSLSENRKALSDHTKVKIKDVPAGENLSEAPKGGRVDIPLSIQDKSTLLVEMTEEINLGTPDNPKVIHFAASLSQQEKIDFVNFFLEKKISFAWSYADMPGLDPELVLHHLSLKADAKPVKQKLRKMHPQVALLVKVELKKLLDVGFIRPIDYAD